MSRIPCILLFAVWTLAASGEGPVGPEGTSIASAADILNQAGVRNVTNAEVIAWTPAQDRVVLQGRRGDRHVVFVAHSELKSSKKSWKLASGLFSIDSAPTAEEVERFVQDVDELSPRHTLIYRPELKPAVEFATRSSMSFDRSHYRAYLSGRVVAKVNYAEGTSRMAATNIVALLERLHDLGFFELSESGIKKRIDEVSAETGKHLAVADYGTDTLIVRYQGWENTVSWHAIESYADRYPEVEELRKLRQCFDLAKGVLIGPLRP